MTEFSCVVGSPREPRPAMQFGAVAFVPVDFGLQSMEIRPAIPADIPTNAVVTSALLKVYVASHNVGLWDGNEQLNCERLTGSWRVQHVNWNNRAAGAGTNTDSVTLAAAPAAGEEITFDVLPDVQDFVSGAVENHGWRIWQGGAAATGFKGFNGAIAGSGQPVLDVTYVIPPQVPENLHPQGTGNSAEPVLTADVSEEATAFEVEVDTTGDLVADFGPFSAVVTDDQARGELDLSTQTWTPASPFNWRAREITPQGTSAWSDWVEYTSLAKPQPNITAPGATTGDDTPTITWTNAGPQVRWRAWFTNLSGKVLADSRWQPGSALAWTPARRDWRTRAKRIRVANAVAHVRTMDVEDRVATSGDPAYAEDEQAFEIVEAGASPGVTELTATAVKGEPWVTLEWVSTETPDEWVIVRNDGRIAEVDDGSARSYVDYTPPGYVEHTYKVLPKFGSVVSPSSVTAVVTTTPGGVWLISVDDPTERVVVRYEGIPDMNVEHIRQGATHNVIGAPPVQRVIADLPPRGSIPPGVLDDSDMDARAAEDRLHEWRQGDPAALFRLVDAHWNIEVELTGVNTWPRDDSDERGHIGVEFAWQQVGD